MILFAKLKGAQLCISGLNNIDDDTKSAISPHVDLEVVDVANDDRSFSRSLNDDEGLDERRYFGSSKVAFMSHLTSDLKRLGHGQHIKFDSVSLNDGDAYDKNTGVFT